MLHFSKPLGHHPSFLTLGIFLIVFSYNPSRTRADTLTVHEWGTFTTLSSSSGEPLTGLYKDATRLPSFVNELPFFNYDSVKGWPSPENLKNVTVKMETPVLYFYSDAEKDVEVEVGFRGGSISQWYPQRTSGEYNPTGPVFDFAWTSSEPYQGSIKWQAKILKPNPRLRPSTPYELETQEWNAPRNTASNYIKGKNGEIEKFLFYRGIGNFDPRLETKFNPDGSLHIYNYKNGTIPYVLVYEFGPREQETFYTINEASIWWEGPLLSCQHMDVKRKKSTYAEVNAAIERFRKAMVKDGLYEDETRALLDTWQNSYFTQETGLKIFWLVPKSKINEILPLKITPSPDKIERVIIGRSEILTPEFEASLIAAYHSGNMAKFASDKYSLAYLDFLNRHGLRGPVTSLQPSQEPSKYPKSEMGSRTGSRSGSGTSSAWLFRGNNPAEPNQRFNLTGRSLPF